MGKHTPGPWQLKPEESDVGYVRIRGTRLGERYKIANVLHSSAEYLDIQETKANARLIAAAPDLLEALQDAALWVDGDLKIKVRAAIAKATGE